MAKKRLSSSPSLIPIVSSGPTRGHEDAMLTDASTHATTPIRAIRNYTSGRSSTTRPSATRRRRTATDSAAVPPADRWQTSQPSRVARRGAAGQRPLERLLEEHLAEDPGLLFEHPGALLRVLLGECNRNTGPPWCSPAVCLTECLQRPAWRRILGDVWNSEGGGA